MIYQVQQLTDVTYAIVNTTNNDFCLATYSNPYMAQRACDDLNAAFEAGCAHAEGLRQVQDVFVEEQ